MRRWIGLAVLLAGLHLAARLALLSADPPATYPGGRVAQELLFEGPAKAHEARRFALTGAATTDDYRVWSVQSPVFVAPLGWFMRLFGPGYASLRVFCGLVGALGLLGLFALARRHASPWVAPIACVIVATNFADIQLTRGGLLEPALDAVLAWTLLCGLLALRSPRWLVACAVGFAGAVLTKQTALVALPVVLALGVAAVLAGRRRGEGVAMPVVMVAAVGVGLALYMGSADYWRTVEWNFGHMIVGVEGHAAVGLGGFDVAAIVARLVDPARWFALYLAVMPLGVLALVQVGRTGVAWLRRRPVEALDLVASGWLLSALLALQLTESVRPRFSLIALPPTALLAASLIAAVVARLGRSRLRLVPLALAAVVVLATDVRWYVRWVRDAGDELATAGRILGAALDASTVVIGDRAAILTFDTAAEVHYVKGPFNTSPARLAALQVTHLLLRRGDRVGAHVERVFPAAYAAKERLLEVRLQGAPVTLYRLPVPLGRGSPR